MSEADTDTETEEPERQTYRLQEGVDRVVRSGLVLEGDETIEAYPDIEREHGDVLEHVDGDAADSDDSGDDDEEADDEDGDA